MFRSSCFWFLVTFGDEVTKILRNLCLHFARQYGQEGKKKERKVTKIPKTKRRNGMNETKTKQNTISYRIDHHNWARYLPLPLHLPLLQISPQGWRAWARAQVLDILALYQVHILKIYIF